MKNNPDLFVDEPIIYLESIQDKAGKWGLLDGNIGRVILPCVCDSIDFGEKYGFMAIARYREQYILFDRHSDFSGFLFFAEWGIPYDLANESIITLMPPADDADESDYEEFVTVLKDYNPIVTADDVIREYNDHPSVQEYLEGLRKSQNKTIML